MRAFNPRYRYHGMKNLLFRGFQGISLHPFIGRAGTWVISLYSTEYSGLDFGGREGV